MAALEELQQAPNLRELLDELERSWADEQRRRHEFWTDADEGIKAEFILGEVVYHSPIYSRHGMASTAILTELLPYVRQKKLGEVGYEKVMIRLTTPQ